MYHFANCLQSLIIIYQRPKLCFFCLEPGKADVIQKKKKSFTRLDDLDKETGRNLNVRRKHNDDKRKEGMFREREIGRVR